jgi:hypothetical protein
MGIGGKVGYSWEQSTNSESSHAGPLRKPSEKDWENQCVFIRGYIIVKRDRLASLWRKPIDIKATEGSPDLKSSLKKDRVGNSPGTSGGLSGGQTSNDHGYSGGGDALQLTSEISVEEIPGTSVVSHSACGFVKKKPS